MTYCTVRRESGRFMIGIGGGVVISEVTTYTGIGRIVVVAVVTACTVIGNVGMCSQQRVIVIVNGEGCRHPVRIGRMTHIAVGRNTQRQVVRVDTLIVIPLVTRYTGIGQVIVIALVTRITVHCEVLTSERPHRTVIEGGWYPGILVVTVNTRCRKLLLQVIRIYCLVIVVGVTACTGVWRIGIVALMTIIAGYTGVRTHDGVERVVER